MAPNLGSLVVVVVGILRQYDNDTFTRAASV
jgi:hypothetical protein